MTKFILTRDINGFNGFGLPFPDDNYTATITVGGGATSVTVPGSSNYWIAVFSYQSGANVWVSTAGTAAVPAGASLASSDSQLNPTARLVKQDEVISIITPDTSANVSISFYSIGQNP